MGSPVDIKGFISRMLPIAAPDDPEDTKLARMSRYRELFANSPIRKQHLLADEGSYFVTNNGQTGLAMTAVAVFTAASPFLVVTNTDSPTNPNARRLYLDYANLVATAAGGWASAGTLIQAALVLDNVARFTSGGTEITANIVNPNMDVAKAASVARIWAGAVVAPAAGPNARTPVGLRTLRPAVSPTVAHVVGDMMSFNFGGVENNVAGGIVVANANIIPVPLPPIILGPGEWALLYLWLAGTTPAAASYAPEVGWWER